MDVSAVLNWMCGRAQSCLLEDDAPWFRKHVSATHRLLQMSQCSSVSCKGLNKAAELILCVHAETLPGCDPVVSCGGFQRTSGLEQRTSAHL